MTIDDRAVRRLLQKEFPKQTNQGMNRGYARVASGFTRSFAKVALSRGGPFHVKRRVRLHYAPGAIRIAPAARKAGFIAELGRKDSLQRKSLSIRTSNPLLKIRELGGTITPKKGTRVRGKKGGSDRLSRKRIPYLAVRIRRRGRGAGKSPFEIRLVRSVTYGQVLGFRRHWDFFRPQTVDILRQAMADVVRRVNSTTERRARRVA